MRQFVSVCEQGKKKKTGGFSKSGEFLDFKNYHILETESPSCNKFLIRPIRATFPAHVIRLN